MATTLAIAFDGSPSAATAVRVAGSLFTGARATVLTVPASPPVDARGASRWLMAVPSATVQQALSDIASENAEEARALAADGAERATAAGLDAEPVVTSGHTPSWETLLAAAREAGADILVCGARGLGGLARAVLGSTSTSLLHHADLPLLIVPDDVGVLDGPVLIAYDGSAAADRAIDVAGSALSGGPAIIVHVWESQYRHSRAVKTLARKDEVGEIVAALDQGLADDAASTTEQGVARARAAGLAAKGETVEATAGVWRTVTSLTRSTGAALVVTGARGVGGARSALLGSVSSGLVHNADAPVLVVHAE